MQSKNKEIKKTIIEVVYMKMSLKRVWRTINQDKYLPRLFKRKYELFVLKEGGGLGLTLTFCLHLLIVLLTNVEALFLDLSPPRPRFLDNFFRSRCFLLLLVTRRCFMRTAITILTSTNWANKTNETKNNGAM